MGRQGKHVSMRHAHPHHKQQNDSAVHRRAVDSTVTEGQDVSRIIFTCRRAATTCADPAAPAAGAAVRATVNI